MSVDAPLPPPLLTHSALEAPLPEPEPPSEHAMIPESVVRTKGGSLSKMRSHKGNIPTLPQTKLCHLCSAKFTRTTHLNRHLKTHTNERLHECDRCHAQFTRSDLLTRHKRTCCDPSASRSRRKSCQNCADSKVKCDLQRPCSKCNARGRECVYTNGPTRGSSGNKSSSQTEGSSPELTTTPSGSSPHQDPPPEAGPSQPPISSTTTTTTALTFPADLFGDLPIFPATTALEVLPLDEDALSITFAGVDTTVTLSGNATASTSAASTSTSQAVVPVQQNSQEDERTYSELFSSTMYDGLFTNVFTAFQKNPAVPGQHFQQDPTTALTDRLEATGIDPATLSVFYDIPTQLAMYDVPLGPLTMNPQASIPESEISLGSSQSLTLRKVLPSIAEMYEYISSFLTTFTYHLPIVHLPTFLEEARIHALIKATKAVGAMYHDTPAATNFINLVLSTIRDEIIAELSQTIDYDKIIQLTLASCLIQTIGMFHRDPEQRAKSNVYHGMIVMMLRMNGFVDKTRDWELEEIDFSNPASVRTRWREWVRYESAKRAIWSCFLHDCCHAIYFNLSPTFRTEQFTLGLPCEDALWVAKDATEWAQVLQTPSAYGDMDIRLRGHFLKALYFYMVENNPTGESRKFSVPPFAHFVMIHAMMRKLFEMYLRDRLPYHQPSEGPVVRPKLNPHFVDRDRVFHLQILLHCWLDSWMSSPESPRDVPESQQRFMFNALPFYWLAQVGLVAYQEGLPPFDPEGVYISSHEAKFHLMKKWEKHIRSFLERGEEAPTMFWDEVMKMRTETWQAETGFQYSNLLGFFLPNYGRQEGSSS